MIDSLFHQLAPMRQDQGAVAMQAERGNAIYQPGENNLVDMSVNLPATEQQVTMGKIYRLATACRQGNPQSLATLRKI